MLAHHAARPLSDEDRRLRPVLGEIGQTLPDAGGYTAAGEPVTVAEAETLHRNPDPGAEADEGDVRVCPPHLARFRHASATHRPRAWRPLIDTAVMYAWIYSTPPTHPPVDPNEPPPMPYGLVEAEEKGGPGGYRVSRGLLESCRELILRFDALRRENAELHGGIQRAADLRNKAMTGCFVSRSLETLLDRRRNAFIRRHLQPRFDGRYRSAAGFQPAARPRVHHASESALPAFGRPEACLASRPLIESTTVMNVVVLWLWFCLVVVDVGAAWFPQRSVSSPAKRSGGLIRSIGSAAIDAALRGEEARHGSSADRRDASTVGGVSALRQPAGAPVAARQPGLREHQAGAPAVEAGAPAGAPPTAQKAAYPRAIGQQLHPTPAGTSQSCMELTRIIHHGVE